MEVSSAASHLYGSMGDFNDAISRVNLYWDDRVQKKIDAQHVQVIFQTVQNIANQIQTRVSIVESKYNELRSL